MTALRSFFSARISSCSASNSRTSSRVYSNVLTRLSSSKSVDIQPRVSCFQNHDRRSQRRRIVERFHIFQRRQHRLNIGALHPAPASVNQAHLAKSALARLFEVLARHVAPTVRMEGM